MNIKRAKQEIKDTIEAYLLKDEYGEYVIPQIRQRPVLPQLTPKALLVQLRNTHAVGIRRNMLRPHIHRHLRQKQISADACSSGNTRFA